LPRQVSHCALRKLSLRRCKMDDVNCATLCEALHNNESLEILDLSGNNLGKYEVSYYLFCFHNFLQQQAEISATPQFFFTCSPISF